MTLTTATVVSPRFYASIIPTCKSLKAVQTVHAHAFKYGLDSNPLVAGNLLLRCAVGLLNALDYAQRLLFETPDPDPFMYNTLIRGYSESDSPHYSISTFSLLIKDLGRDAVDSFSLAFSMKAAANMRCLSTGFQLHCQAMGRGFTGNLFVGTTLVSLYGECGSLDYAEKVFDEIPERSVVTWNALVTSFARCGDMEGAEKVFNDMKVRDLASSNIMIAGYVGAGEFDSARRVFEEMPERDEVSWSTLISGFVGYGRLDEAFGCFRELVRDGMKVNEVGLTAVLSACAQAGAVVFANALHGLIEKLGLVWITTVNNALIDAYAKCGSINMARLVFDRVPGEKSIVSWTSMLVALASQGYGEEALSLFHEMEKSGIELDGIAFIVMLYACSHAGLVEQGCEIFEKMTTAYKIKPEIEHYGCMVDLYGRAGQLSKAYDFASQMPIQPTAVIWRTLLGACSFHGNVRLAEQVSKRLAELDPSHCGDHVLLSNIYAVAKKWKDVASVRKSMTQMRITKSPGWSMIEVDKVMYTFVAGAKQDSVTKEALEKLKDIMLKLRHEGGYVPEIVDVFHDIEEEEKEDAIVTHSEKLAVAFGLSRLADSNDVVIRIVKNLRVCRDCHSVMKSISKVYGLQIVLRDRSRFHSFNNGICSCRDYW